MKVITLQQSGGTMTYVMDGMGYWTCVQSGQLVGYRSPLHNTLTRLVNMH